MLSVIHKNNPFIIILKAPFYVLEVAVEYMLVLLLTSLVKYYKISTWENEAASELLQFVKAF